VSKDFSPTVYTSAISTMLKYAQRQGHEARKIFSAADVDFSKYSSPESRMTLRESDRIAEQAFFATGCENLGLRSGQLISPGNWNIVGYIMMNCDTLGDAFKNYCIYERIISEGNRTKLSVQKKLATIEVELVADTAITIKQHSENILSCMLRLMKLLTGEEIMLSEVHFTHDPPRDISDYREIFRAPLLFRQAENAILLDKEYLDLPILQPNRHLLSLLEQHARNTLLSLTQKKGYREKVRYFLMRKVPFRAPPIEIIARELGMSPRTLQLKLKAEGTCYQALLDGVRKDMAINYLRSKDLSVTDIAYLLGFSEPSSFSRTFKRWTGFTPCEFRKVC